MSGPLRFLILAIAGWVGFRALMLMPAAVVEPPAGAEARPTPPRTTAAAAPELEAGTRWTVRVPWAAVPGASARPPRMAQVRQPIQPEFPPVFVQAPLAATDPGRASFVRPAPALAAQVLRRAAEGRWSASAWLLVRGDGGTPLAAAGTLGASQAGFRLAYRLARPLAVSARISSPLANRRGAEAALGLDWRPLVRVPVNLLAERRQAIGRDGRSAFAITLYGGVAERLPLGFRLEAYAQAGVVGARSRDLFADGAARLGLPVGAIEVGASVSGGAQPGLARLDAGPQITFRLPVAGERMRVTAEWRFRIAGEARPGSGPALTLASDF